LNENGNRFITVFKLKMSQGELLWYCFEATMQTLRLKNPDIKMWQVLSKLKLWVGKNRETKQAIYFLEDYWSGKMLTAEGMYGMHGVLKVLKLFYDNGELVDPSDKEDTMFPSEMM
jgi:hypothetical protein